MNKSLKVAIVYAILVFSIASTFYVLKFTHSCNCLNKWIFCDLANQDFTKEESRYTILYALLARISLYLFVHASLVMLIRIVRGKTSPATQQDPETIKLLNRIITNTIEQTVVFVGLYAYFLFEKAGDKFNSVQLMTFASWFILARVAFSVTYIFGNLIGFPNLRAFGFALNVAVNVLLIELCFCKHSYVTDFFFAK